MEFFDHKSGNKNFEYSGPRTATQQILISQRA